MRHKLLRFKKGLCVYIYIHTYSIQSILLIYTYSIYTCVCVYFLCVLYFLFCVCVCVRCIEQLYIPYCELFSYSSYDVLWPVSRPKIGHFQSKLSYSASLINPFLGTCRKLLESSEKLNFTCRNWKVCELSAGVPQGSVHLGGSPHTPAPTGRFNRDPVHYLRSKSNK